MPDRAELSSKAKMAPIKPERSVEDWVVNRFGRELFETFFKSYTEKVWGMSTRTITADWAAQRIKDLNLVKAVTSALFGRFRRRGTGDQDADRGVLLSAAGARPDVGSDSRPDQRAGGGGAPGPPRGGGGA